MLQRLPFLHPPADVSRVFLVLLDRVSGLGDRVRGERPYTLYPIPYTLCLRAKLSATRVRFALRSST